jgi:hypothetical protein
VAGRAIADIEMPGEDDLLCSRARAMASARNRRLPALALTAWRAEDRGPHPVAFTFHLPKRPIIHPSFDVRREPRG